MEKPLILVPSTLDFHYHLGSNVSHFFLFFYLAALMKNTGVLFANDANKVRVNGIVGNFHRLGITNSIITCCDGRTYPQVISYAMVLFFLFGETF